MSAEQPGENELVDKVRWYHLDGTECVAGWSADGPNQGRCSEGGGPVTPCPNVLCPECQVGGTIVRRLGLFPVCRECEWTGWEVTT